MKSVLGLGVLLLGLAYAPSAHAAKQYASYRAVQNNTGGYFSAPNVSMNSGWSSSNPCNFLIKTQWLSFKGASSANDDWIELGRVHGAVERESGGTYNCGTSANPSMVSYYDAYYTATMKFNSTGGYSYREWPITTISTAGSHSYQIKKVSSNTDWRGYIDNIQVLTYPGWNAANAAYQDVGWEANYATNTTPTWTSPNYANPLKFLINGSWTDWSSTNVTTAGSGSISQGSLGWAVSTDGASYKLKYTR